MAKPASIALTEFHPWRHGIELRRLRPRLEAYWTAADSKRNGTEEERENHYQQVVKPLEDAFLAEFPPGVPDNTAWEVILREERWRHLLDKWRRDGQPIFSFAPDLVAALSDTDVDQMPIQNLRVPYDLLFIGLPPGHFLPDYHSDWVIDGLYLEADACLADTLRSAPRPPAEVIAEARELWDDLERRPGALDKLRERNADDFRDYETYVTDRLRENAAAQQLYDRYLADPDAVMDELAARTDDPNLREWHPYWMVTAEFTFRRRDHAPAPLSLAELFSQPTLRANYDFVSHRDTVADGIERNRRRGLPMETFREDVEHPNDLRNAISDPSVIDEVTRLVFNLLCYLNYPERDQEKRLNDSRAQEKVERARGKARKVAEAKAHQDGCRWIEFCGYRTAFEQSAVTGGNVSGHWRRGHWRNQRYGKALAETKLLWIRPTMVGADGEHFDRRATVYNTADRR